MASLSQLYHCQSRRLACKEGFNIKDDIPVGVHRADRLCFGPQLFEQLSQCYLFRI
jgi:hypothetical protein